MWTLWLITYATVIGQGGASPIVTPLATYQTQHDCQVSLEGMYAIIKSEYGPKNPPSPGLGFCVEGTLVRK